MNATVKPVAVVLADDFEDSELKEPVAKLEAAGYLCELVGRQQGEAVRGKKGSTAVIDKSISEVSADDYVALLIPGGYSPDHLRTMPDIVTFVVEMASRGKSIAAICHGPQLLIEAGLVSKKMMTSWSSVRTDLVNAGARWVDREVVVDGNIISSRKPDDIDAFCRALLDSLERAA